MAKILLTDAAVKKYRAGSKRREIADNTTGLYLVIQPSGAKSWALRFRRPDGRPAKLVLGPLDLSGKEPEGDPVIGAPLTLASARALAAEQHRQRKRGIDVAARHVSEKRRAKQAAATATANSFAALAIRFIAEHKVKKTGERPRRWNDSARMLGLGYPKDGSEPSMIKGGLAQRWADKPVSSITGDDLHDLVEEARLRGIPGLERRRDSASNTQGRAMAAVLSVFFSWAKDNRYITVNPAVDIYKPNAPKARDRALNAKPDMRRADEVRWFWSACDSLNEPFDTILKLSLLTGCRLNEIARLRADEVSDDLTTLRIPGERTKNHLPHDVYLPPLARDLLAGVRRIDGAKFVFTTTGSSPVSGWSKTKRNLDAAMLALGREERKDAEIKPWRLHDLRRSAATGMAGIGIAPHIIEACLNHISGAKAGVAGTYNRETYQPEKRVAWQRWALHIESIVTGREAKVVDIHKTRA